MIYLSSTVCQIYITGIEVNDYDSRKSAVIEFGQVDVFQGKVNSRAFWI